jgi:hypothetical protein
MRRSMDHIDAEAASSKVLDLEGRPLPLGVLWAERTAVLVFVRHFG